MPRSHSPRTTAAHSPGRTPARAAAWISADVVLILVFAASGRRTHEHGMSVLGVLDTAWPFLVAYALAVLLLRAWRLPAALLPTGVVLWLGAAAGGLALRAAAGDGVAPSFQVVTLTVLGVFLLVPRVVAGVLQRARNRRGSVGSDPRPPKGTP